MAKDPGVTRGSGTDVEASGVGFTVAYANSFPAGACVLPTGSVNGWLANSPLVAKFVNRDAPSGPTQARVSVIKPGRLVKLVGKGLGDTPFNILDGGDLAGSVYTAFCVTNGGAEYYHCSDLTSCT